MNQGELIIMLNKILEILEDLVVECRGISLEDKSAMLEDIEELRNKINERR